MATNTSHSPLRLAVLVSGDGTNLQALIDNQSTVSCSYHIFAVFSDRKNAFALERAKNAAIITQIVSPYAILGSETAKVASRDEKRLAVSNRVLELCTTYTIDAIVLSGFLTVLDGDLVHTYSGRIINIHPALLPKFGGKGMWGHHVHKAVLAAGEVESGCTVHLVDSGCDTGRILLQKKVAVLPNDTPKTLATRIAPQEHIALIEGINILHTLVHT